MAKQPVAPIFANVLGIVTIASLASVAVTAAIANPPIQSTLLAQASRVKNPQAFDLAMGKQPFFPALLGQSDNPFPFRAIIGRDNRVPMMSRQFPWSAVGRIEGIAADGSRYSCTGTLIAKSIVLTNAHCVVDPDRNKVSQVIKFKPNLVNGTLKDETDVGVVEAYHYGTDFQAKGDNPDINDWAILKLDKPLGEKYGFLGWKAPTQADIAQYSRKLALVGYSADFPRNTKAYPGIELTAGPGLTAAVHRGCSITGEANGLLLHDCDTKGGASGGPILGKVDDRYYVLALHAGWKRLDGQITNYAVKINQIEDWLNRSASQDRR